MRVYILILKIKTAFIFYVEGIHNLKYLVKLLLNYLQRDSFFDSLCIMQFTLNLITCTIGANVSFWTIFASWDKPVTMVGSTKWPGLSIL